MSYFRVNSEDHYDQYAGDKKIENGVYLVSTTAKKTLGLRLAWLRKKVKSCTPEEEAEMQYQKQIDFFLGRLKSRGLDEEAGKNLEAPF